MALAAERACRAERWYVRGVHDLSPRPRRPWVGRSVPRVEDEALLRGEGRFIDDLAPVARTRHAAIVRSQFAHARIVGRRVRGARAARASSACSPARTSRALSRPFPAGIETGVPQYAAAVDTARYVGEPVAVVVARDRYLAEDAAELVEVDYDPLDPVLDPVAAAAGAVHDRSFSYGDVDARVGRGRRRRRRPFHVPALHVHAGRVLRRRRRLGRDRGRADRLGELPGAVHAALRRRRRARPAGARLRLITPPDSGGSFGIKSSVFAYVVLIGLASRKLGVPVRWTEDRLEHLAASAASTGAHRPSSRPAFTADGELLALRYDAIEDVGAYVRAPEPATLYRMHGSLSGAYRVPNVARPEPRRAHEPLPSGLNRGFGGPQLYFALERTMAIAAAAARPRPGRARTPQPRPGRRRCPTARPSGALYDSGDYEACLDDALELAGYDALRARARRARAEGRLAGIGLACVVEPSISNMGYITLAQTADERALALPKSGNAEGASIAIDPLGGITVRLATTPQGQGHRTVCAQVVADALGCDPEDVTVLSRDGHRERAVDASPRATTRRGSPASPSARSRPRR